MNTPLPCSIVYSENSGCPAKPGFAAVASDSKGYNRTTREFGIAIPAYPSNQNAELDLLR